MITCPLITPFFNDQDDFIISMLAATRQQYYQPVPKGFRLGLILMILAVYGLVTSFPGHTNSSGFASHLPVLVSHSASDALSHNSSFAESQASPHTGYATHSHPNEAESSEHFQEHDSGSHSHETPDRQDSPELRALVIPSALLVVFLAASLPRLVSRLDRPPIALSAF